MPLKVLWFLTIAFLLAIWMMAFSMRTDKSKPEPYYIIILGKYNRTYVVYGSSMQNANIAPIIGNHLAQTIVVIKCPITIEIRGDNNEVFIDEALRETVRVEDHGAQNVYVFSD